MSKSAIIGAVVIVGIGVAGGGGYYYISQQAEHKFQEQVNLVQSALPGSTLTYANHHISLFSKEATIDKVVLTAKDGTVYNADKVDVIVGSGSGLSKLIIDKFTMRQNNQDKITFDHLDVTDANLGAGAIITENGQVTNVLPSKLSFGLLNVQNLVYNNNSRQAKIASYQVKNYGLGQKSDIIINNFSGTDPKNEFKIASVKFDEINQAEIVQDIEGLIQNVKENPSLSSILSGYLQLLSIAEFKELNIHDLQDLNKNGLSLKLAQYTLKDYGIKTLVHQSFQDFSLTGANSYLKVASFQNGGASLPLIYKSVQASDIINAINANDIYSMIAAISKAQSIYIQQMKDAKIHTEFAGIQAFDGTDQFSLGKISVDSQATDLGVSSVFYKLDNFNWMLRKDDPKTQALQDCGYDQLSVSGALKVNYSVSNHLLSLSLEDLSLKDMGKLGLTFKIYAPVDKNNMNPQFALTSNLQMALMNPAYQFAGLSMNLQNTGLIERVINYSSKKQGVSQDDVKKSLLMYAKGSLVYLKGVSPSFVEEAGNALDNFLQNPQTTSIELTANPENPIAFSSLLGQSSEDIVSALNMKISTIPVK